MRLATIPTAALCACSLLVAAGCNKGGNTTNKTLVNTTTTTTNTSNASQPAASTLPTAEVTKSSADNGVKAAKPEDAAEGLFNAWKAKDRAAASKYASDIAVKTLFDEGSAEGLEFQGCNKDEDGGDFYNCAYTYEGGAVFMQVTGNDADGYKVTGAGFVAD